MDNLKNTTFLFGYNSIFIEELYAKYLQDKNLVDQSWQEFFANYQESLIVAQQDLKGATWAPRDSKTPKDFKDEADFKDEKVTTSPTASASTDHLVNSLKAQNLIKAYREKGHFLAGLDPLGLERRAVAKELGLSLEDFGFSADDLDKNIDITASNFLNICELTLARLISALEKIYSSTAALEFMHLENSAEREYLMQAFELSCYEQSVAKKHQLKILQDLIEVEAFENFLHIKFPGTKRFSIEGGAGAICCLEETIMELSELAVEEVVIGMAHRGRLSSITKIIGKPYVGIFAGFNGISSVPADIKISSDVKYHLGASALRTLDNGKEIKLSLTYNPSHLEAVNPVTTGKVRAKQEKIKDIQRDKVVCLLVHGDAAFAGQGVVAETLSFAQLEGFNVGGTIHLVINNQVGFTANPQDARAGRYPTEVAKIINAPIFHINGNDPQAIKKASIIAANFRQKFKKDIVIDVTCYRLYGHNEGDEPFFTQPLMYKEIAKQKPLFELYGEKLIASKVLSAQEYKHMLSSFRAKLDAALEQSKDYVPTKPDCFEGNWQGFLRNEEDYEEIYQTGINIDLLKKLGIALTNTPSDFNVNAKIQRQLEAKVKMIQSGENIDWSLGEALAYATLLWDGYKIRLCGQDSGRGTFSHRHAVLIDQVNQTNYIPLNNINAKANFEVIDSNLSEFGVLGFEYGYSQADPRCLNIWEGQFGDFSNGAQVIIDQFIASAEQKWLRFSGLVMLLPHGFEGQGPEHSSARLERFLQLCAQENIQVANCTTPASFFHLLRRQMRRNYRKPLIIMTPKSLLRHKLATSSLVDFADNTHFKTVIAEHRPLIADEKVSKVILCSGKVYYDLYEYREKSQKNDVAIIRIEQYYPFPTNSLAKELYRYKNAQIIWVQEEPKNMGAWTFMKTRVNKVLQESEIADKYFRYIGRKEAASPAVGYLKVHNQEQEDLIKRAFY